MMAKDIDVVLQRAHRFMNKDLKKSWFSKLPSAAQKRLLEIKKAYISGRFSGVSVASLCVAVESLLKEQSWPVPKSHNTIIRWLRSSDI